MFQHIGQLGSKQHKKNKNSLTVKKIKFRHRDLKNCIASGGVSVKEYIGSGGCTIYFSHKNLKL